MIDVNLYRGRRQRLAEQMGRGVAVLSTAPERLRNRDAHYPFRFDSYFHYLTGFPEPEAVTVVIASDGNAKSLLFCRDKDIEREIWDGFRYGPEAAREAFGFDEAHSHTKLDEMIPKLLADQPEYALFLSWHIGEELAPKLREKGFKGKFIVPLPTPRVLDV